jgi:hypothetical protein
MLPNSHARVVYLCLCLVCVFAFGCGGQSTTSSASPTADEQRRQTLLEVGEMYRMYVASNKKAPTKADDFRGSQPVAPLGYRAVKDGAVVVRWGTRLNDTSEAGSNDSSAEVLAYEKKVPEQGGDVLMKNRTIKSMTAEEFKASPRSN